MSRLRISAVAALLVNYRLTYTKTFSVIPKVKLLRQRDNHWTKYIFYVYVFFYLVQWWQRRTSH